MDDVEAATRWGVEPGYHDVSGSWHSATPLALRNLTAVLSRGRDAPSAAVSPGSAVAYQCDDRRMWGLAIQLYALRSERNWGHGDFGDLLRLVETLGALRCCAVGLNPLHALFAERAEDASPYSPSSRQFLNPLYIDLHAIDEFPGIAALGLEAELAELRAATMVQYTRVAGVKLTALRACYSRFGGASAARRRDFEMFQDEQGEALVRFAAFEVLRRRFGNGTWWTWPEPWQRPSKAQLAEICTEHADEIGFHMYVQWLADSQLGECQRLAVRLGMPIGLYVDLAVGVDPAGADAWTGQDDMLSGVSVGAPPDYYNPAGQNWGLTTFNPHVLTASDFAPMRQLLRAAMRHAGAIRIDHVLGLMRLFLIPRGADAADGAYVRYPFEALLAAVAEESQRARCVVIGEDLGTVPEGFRDAVARRGLWTYLVMLFEREHGGAFRTPDRYAENALATFNTHDLPTFHGWISGHDLELKRGIGVDPGETDEDRERSRTALRAALSAQRQSHDFAGIARYLARTPSRLVMVALEDILGVAEQINIPGTVEQHPNWRRRVPLPLERLNEDRELARIAEVFAEAGRALSGR